MSQPQDPGRLDHLARGIFNRLVNRHPNPAVKIAARMFDQEIGECMEENLGPGTKADEVGRRILKAFDGDGK